jgi:putative transposase
LKKREKGCKIPFANKKSCDYPKLNTLLFVEIWLMFIFDRSINSMRDLFRKLKFSNINLDISTFSKALKSRDIAPLQEIYLNLVNRLNQSNPDNQSKIIPIDSTIIRLASKLFWQKGYHQVKMLNSFDFSRGVIDDFFVSFGQNHDMYFKEKIINMIPQDSIAVMDRGFCSYQFIDQLCQINRLFIVRIKRNMKRPQNNNQYRVVSFCDLENKAEYHLASNLWELRDEEIAEMYRQRWQIELLYKFLKSHLKLDKLISKNENGVLIQIYMTLIGYMLLQLIEIPVMYGKTLLDKLCYVGVLIHHWLTVADHGVVSLFSGFG